MADIYIGYGERQRALALYERYGALLTEHQREVVTRRREVS